ncbi:tRNA delta(2)-isopentenylpyrophosphate transferase [Liberibacter crescens BT-1]|uniref:tRNA dimethylallyltransferase n=2 Tax=Liberibacter crescens TaxID=1273132 RepID=L0EW83_LIBCB|nr:tRNA delta(2)-isopentenylpyrophosphate transferase [Liberibacter crescens BT-1]AMC12745.1 tRNA delta(2)-isopentenylpyrophosphate transferase [Liberibacter crescens]
MVILSQNINIILITGPTASGKSGFALQLADKYNGEIINADSMQVYDIIQILTSRPSIQDMRGIPHHLYGHIFPGDSYSTGEWLRCAKKMIFDIQKRGHLPVVVGGTGLYFRALTGNFSEMPDVPDSIRKIVREWLHQYGTEALYSKLASIDFPASQKIKSRDGQRIARALEIFMSSGKSITQFWEQSKEQSMSSLSPLKLLILPERDELNKNIKHRFKYMMDNGAVEEVQKLVNFELSSDLPAMKAIGVRDIILMLKNEISYEQTLERGVIATRQYAKRQITWFRNQLDKSWQRIPSLKEFI